MARTLILGNNPNVWWMKDIKDAEIISVPNIANGRNLDITNYLLTLPTDVDCIAIDADSLNSANIELPLDLILHIRLMLHDCRKTSLSSVVLVSDLSFETYKGYGPKSMVLMTQNVVLVNSEDAVSIIQEAKPMTPAEYVSGFIGIIKIEPQEKIEGRHSIANEWGAEALYNVISSGVKSNIISIKASSSLYFKYSNVAALNAKDVEQIVEGHVSRFLTRRISIKDNVKYLLIDDEANKGWDKALQSLLPNAEQDIWDTPITSYEEISEDIRQKISNGDYDLIFLDLRMSGVAEEGIMKPEEFSGMNILSAIKKANKGIQVIMLTATNKAWNVKALLDAGANGYYMKESPEYHFSLKYSEQNALALVETIKECIKNSYLQDIVAQQKGLLLPSDSELSDSVYNQLSIAVSLILKAKEDSEYAFAYISLEQVFEIASAYFIRQESAGEMVEYYFKEGSEEHCCSFCQGIKQGYLISPKEGNPVALWQRVAAIYYQLLGGADKSFGENTQKLISLRNQYIHPQNKSRPVISSEDFIDLFEVVMDFLSLYK